MVPMLRLQTAAWAFRVLLVSIERRLCWQGVRSDECARPSLSATRFVCVPASQADAVGVLCRVRCERALCAQVLRTPAVDAPDLPVSLCILHACCCCAGRVPLLAQGAWPCVCS